MKKILIVLVIAFTLISAMSSVEATAIQYESITVTDTAVGLTPSKYNNAMGQYEAFCTLETAQIRFTVDGSTTPTATVGHLLEPGQILYLKGYTEIANFRAVRTGSSSGILMALLILLIGGG